MVHSHKARAYFKGILELGDNPNILQLLRLVELACKDDAIDMFFSYFRMNECCQKFFDNLRKRYMESYRALYGESHSLRFQRRSAWYISEKHIETPLCFAYTRERQYEHNLLAAHRSS
jgi:hypothetical protein